MEGTTQPPLKFLPICEGNRLAAIILDYLYRYSLIFDCVEKYAPFRVAIKQYGDEDEDDDYYYDPISFKKYLHYKVNVVGELEYDNLEDFRSDLVPIAYEAKASTDAQLIDAINFLCHKKRFIFLSGYVQDEGFSLYCSDYYRKNIDLALSRLQEVMIVPPPPAPLFDRYRQRKIVNAQNSRASKAGLPAVLTVDEWISTLEYYKGRCAFNANHPYEVLEHFHPLSGPTNGAGTSVFNCIPACNRCNITKADTHPTDLPSPLKEAVPAIQAYLSERKEQWLKKHYALYR